MPIAEILNKVATQEKIDPVEASDLKSWVKRFPDTKPVISKMLKGGEGSDEDFKYLQNRIDAGRRADALRTEAKAIDTRSWEDKGLGEKLASRGKDLVASFGAGSESAAKMAVQGIGFVGDIAARAIASQDPEGERINREELPPDLRQKIEGVVGAPLEMGLTSKEAMDRWQGMKSEDLQAREANLADVGKASFKAAGGGFKGALSQAADMAAEIAKDPFLLATQVSSQLPMVAPAMAGGIPLRMAGMGAKGIQAAITLGSAAMQGADPASQVYDDLMGADQSVWDANPEYKALKDSGMDSQSAKQQIANAQSRKAFAGASVASAALNALPMGNLTEKYAARMGLSAAERIALAKAPGMVTSNVAKLAEEGAAKTALKGVLRTAGESASEMVDEGVGAFAGGKAKSQITGEDPYKDIGENASAAAFGLGPVSLGIGMHESFQNRAEAREKVQSAPATSQSAVPAIAAITGPETPAAAPASVDITQPSSTVAPAPVNIESTQRTANLEAKRRDIADGFNDLLAANPAMAPEAAKWREANPMGQPADFEQHFQTVREGAATEMAAQSPKVVEARAQATQVQAQADAAQQIATGAVDPSQAPPAGLSIKEAQASLADGGKAFQEKAKAAQENARTVQQTVEKEIHAAEPPSPTEGVLKDRQKAAKLEFTSYRSASESGAVDFDPKKYNELATKAGIPDAAIANHASVTVQKIEQRRKKEIEKVSKEKAKAAKVSQEEPAAPKLFTPSAEEIQAQDSQTVSDLVQIYQTEGKAAAEAHFQKIVPEQGIPVERQAQIISKFKEARTVSAAMGTAASSIPSAESKIAAEKITAGISEPSGKPSYGEGNKIFSKASKDEAIARLKAKLDAQRSTLSSNPGFDPEFFTLGAQIAGFHIEAGTRKFVDVAMAVASDLGDTVRGLRKYMDIWYNGARDVMEREGMDVSQMDSRESVSRQLVEMMDAKPAAESVGTGKQAPLVKALQVAGEMPKDNPGLKKMMTEIDGQVPDLLRMKEGQEALETIIGMRAHDRVALMRSEGATQSEIFLAMREIYAEQPNLNIRTSTSMETQAYSTPVPLGYLAGELAKVENSTVYEPTAGNGLLLIGADPGKVWANELDSRRFENLRGLGFANIRQGTAEDAITSGFIAQKSVETVLANPPFGKIMAGGEAVKVEYDNFMFTKQDHLIAAKSLLAMKDNGRATLILGGSKEAMSGIDKLFFGWLYKRYNVIGHFQVAGDLYSRQGASWPVRVIVINGRGKSSLDHRIEPRTAAKWSEVLDYGKEILGSEAFGQSRTDIPGNLPEQPTNRRERGPNAPGRKVGGSDLQGEGGRPGSGEDGGQPSTGSVGTGRSDGGTVASDIGRGGVSEPVGLQPDGTVATSSGSTGESGEPVALDGARSSVDAGVDLDALVQPYTPKGYVTELDAGLFVPTNLLDPMMKGEEFLRSKIGDPVVFAAKELGYTPDEMKQALMGAQAESVAGAIYNMKNGMGTIIADNTGIGKGRQAYMMIRWAIRNGIIPVFVTEKPSLFSAMYQDGLDCGDNGFTKPFIINSDASIEVERDDGKVDILPKYKYGKEGRKTGMEAIGASGKLPGEFNAIFATYSQFNQANTQRSMLSQLAKNSILILDEAHKASGEESSVGAYFRGVMKAFKGVAYFSATWAKRPGNMSSYTKTAIGDIGMNDDELTLAITEGGYPLQSIIASSLANQGQFYRRERSFEGIEYETVVMSKHRAEHERIHDELTERLRSIMDADAAFTAWFEDTYKPQLIKAGDTGVGHVNSKTLVTRAPFASTVHNCVRQISLALKADECAALAIEALERGESPVIAVDSTMGTFIADFVRSAGLMPGDAMTDFGWSQILKRYLDRTLYYNVKSEENKTVRVEIPRSHLPTNIEAMYRDAEDLISTISVDAPASPLDWLKFKIQQAGYSIDEITGGTRDLRIDYSGMFPVLTKVTDTKKQHEKIRRDFNTRKLDVVLINKSGFTGISMHSDRRWTTPGQRGARRHFIGMQMALDINDVKQAFGRVDRTGQIVPPKYTIVSLDLPSEKRPLASLQRKFKSLNTSTSSNTKGNMDVEGVDLFNKYGDEIVRQFLAENPAMAERLGINLEAAEPGKMNSVEHDLAEKATGRLALLPVEQQKFFYAEVVPRYNEQIDFLTKSGQNKLLTRTVDLDAREVNRATIYPGTGNEGPFSGPAHLVEMSCKPTGRILNPQDVQAEIDGILKGSTPEENRLAMLAEAADAWKAFLGNATPEAIEKAGKAKRDTAHLLPAVGTTWTMNIMGDEIQAVVTRVRWNGAVGGNPYAASKWSVRLATNTDFQHVSMPLSRFLLDSNRAMDLGLADIFVPNEASRSTKKIIVGNILGAYTQLNKSGEIISFTDDKGNVVKGMVLPKSFNMATDLKSQVKIQGGENITGVMQKLNGSIDPFMTSEDGEALVTIQKGIATIELNSAARAVVTKWAALTGLEFAGKIARVEIGPKSVDAFSKVSMNVERSILEDTGIIQEGQIKPEAFLSPTELFDSLNPHTISMAVEIVNRESGNSWGERESTHTQTLQRIKDASATMGKMTGDLMSMFNGLRDGTNDMKTMKKLFKDLGNQSIRRVDPKVKSAQAAFDQANQMLRDVKDISGLVMRASMYQKIKGKRVATNLASYEMARYTDRVKEMFPYAKQFDLKPLLEFCLWSFNNKNPEEQITNLSDRAEQVRFTEYMSGQKKLAMKPWTMMAAMVVGTGAIGLSSAIMSPAVFSAAMAGVSLYGARRFAKSIYESKARPRITPRGEILSVVNTSGLNSAVSENLDQVYLRYLEIKAKSDVQLDKIRQAIQKAAIRSIIGPDASGVSEFIQKNIWTSAPVKARLEEFSTAIPDFLEGLAPLPAEIAHVGDSIKGLREFFAQHMEGVGSKTREDHFHRVYDFEGLRSLKDDPAALDSLCEQLAPEVMKNAYDQVENFATRNGIADVHMAAKMFALATLSGMYDGSEEASKNISKQWSSRIDEFANKLMMDRYGEANTKFYYAIREQMRSKVNPYTASGMKKRKVPFNIPGEWALSDGSTVKLVERDYFKVQQSYNETMSRSLAQKEVMLPNMITRFLNSIGPNDAKTKDGKDRIRIEEHIQNDLNHRNSGIQLSEPVRAIANKWKTVNSVMYLGLSLMFPIRNLAFGGAKAAFFLGWKNYVKAGGDLTSATFLPRGEKYQRAREAGAIFEKIGDSVIGGQSSRFMKAITYGMTHSQQAVDMAGFYGGIYYAPQCALAASKGDPEAIATMREAFGPELSEEILSRPTLGMTNDELDRFGLLYRNLISGTARNINLPKFMGGEIGKFLFQFSSIPTEDSRMFIDRIVGRKGESRYYAGLALAGSIIFGIQAALSKAVGGDDDDKPDPATETVLKIFQSGGGFNMFNPIVRTIVSEKKFMPERIALQMVAGGMLPLQQAVKVLGAGVQAKQNLENANESGADFADLAMVGMIPFARLLWNEPVLMGQIDEKMDQTTDLEQSVR